MANCSACGTKLTLFNRDLTALSEPICGQCAQRKSRKPSSSPIDNPQADLERAIEKQAAISRRLREENGDQRPTVTQTKGHAAKVWKTEQTSLPVALHDMLAPFCLGVAQTISILGCVGSIAHIPITLLRLHSANLLDSLSGTAIAMWVIGTVAGFTYSYAMAIVFSNARRQRTEGDRG